MATNLNVTELDFDQIKKNLKNYLKTQTAFNSHDFEGSGLSSLLDILAYNTHYNAMTAHFALNEAFLDSAQIRGNIVTRAKLLGYIPRSVLAPRATINIIVDVSGESGTIPSTLTLPRGAKLSTEVDQEARNYFKEKVYQTVIQRNVRLSEAPSHGVPVLIYDKNCPGSKSYYSFTDEFINQENQIGSAA